MNKVALDRSNRLLPTLLCVGLLAGAHSSAASAGTCAQGGVVTNPLASTITLDGQFTGGIGAEWSDVTPACFISPPTPNGTLLRTNDMAAANSLLYAAIAPGLISQPNSGVELYLIRALNCI